MAVWPWHLTFRFRIANEKAPRGLFHKAHRVRDEARSAERGRTRPLFLFIF